MMTSTQFAQRHLPHQMPIQTKHLHMQIIGAGQVYRQVQDILHRIGVHRKNNLWRGHCHPTICGIVHEQLHRKFLRLELGIAGLATHGFGISNSIL